MRRKLIVLLTGLLMLATSLVPASPAQAKVANMSTAWNAPGTPYAIAVRFHDGLEISLLPGNTTTATHGGVYGFYNGVGTCQVFWYLVGSTWYYQATSLSQGWMYLPDGKRYGINGGYRNSQGGCSYRT